MLMKLVHKLLFAVVMTMSCVTANAARLTAVVHEYNLKYQSVDAMNNPITLSEKIYVNLAYQDINFIMVHNHPTTTADKLVPTGSEPQIEQVKYMCDGTERAMVIAPDYQGYGESYGTTHPYMCSTLTARNIVDGILAAMDYIVTQKSERHILAPFHTPGNYYFKDGYYTLNVGYSQGGAATLAVHKYIENEASKEVRDRIKLKKSICGAGPHLQSYMFDVMENGGDAELGRPYEMEYPLYLPYTIDGLMYTFGNSTMRGITEEEIYTAEFLKSKLLEQIRQKNTIANDMNQAINEYFAGKGGQCTFFDIIRRDEYENRNSKLYRTLQKALKQCDLLQGWKTKAELAKEGRKPTPIIFYHWSGDKVVPYHESEMALEYFKSLGYEVGDKKNTKDVAFWNPEGSDITGEWSLTNIDLIKNLVGLDLDDSHMGYGTRFYLSIFSGTLR